MKKVLITGAAKGIGAAFCKVFSKAGYFVLAHYFKSEEKAKNLQKQILKNGGMCEIFKANLTKQEEVEKMFFKIYEDFGFIDVLINNAGIAQQKIFLETTLKDWNEIFYSNLFSMFFCSKQVLPKMIKHKKGNIINISSVWGKVGAALETIYSASKAAVIGFSKALFKEVAISNVRVNCIAPGVIKTDMLKNLTDLELKDLKEKIPCEKIGTPEDVAYLALFLADEKSSYINGEVLNVGGGFFG